MLEVQDPDARVVVTRRRRRTCAATTDPVADDAVRGEGDAVELLEMLSTRDVGVPVPPAVRDLTAGLAVVFDQAEAT